MRIGVDVRHLEMSMGTGGAQLLHHCLRALAQHDTTNEYVRYHQHIGRFGRGGGLRSSLAALGADVFSKNVLLPAWARAKKLDALIHFIPPCSFTLSGIEQYAYVLDVPHPDEADTAQDRFYNNVFITKTCRRADHLIAISQFVADQVVESLGIDPEKISVIYPCIDTEVFHPPEKEREGFLLGVISKMCDRKNPGAYIEIYRRLPQAFREKHRLRIAGQARSLEDFVPFVSRDALDEVADTVDVLGVTNTTQTADLYGTASVVLFPSKFEGFGLPMVEAAACGADMVGSNIPAFREVAAPTASLHDVDDWEGMAEACRRFIEDPVGVAERSCEAVQWGQRFNYGSYADKLQALLARRGSIRGDAR